MCELPPPWKCGSLADAADHGDAPLAVLQRQDAVVLEQDHAFAGDLARQGMVRRRVELRRLSASRPP